MVIYKKKTKNLKPNDPPECGEVWTSIAKDRKSKLRIASVCGKRTEKEADELLGKVKSKLDPSHPLPNFSSDKVKQYPQAFLKHFGREQKEEGKRRGRPRVHPKIESAANLNYGQVVKKRKKGRVVKITKRVVFGQMKQDDIYTSIVERGNLTIRMTNGRVVRKTLGFSKSLEEHRNAQILNDSVYNFVKVHKSLRILNHEGKRKWFQRTPAMAAGLTDHVWSLEELLTYKVSPSYFDSS